MAIDLEVLKNHIQRALPGSEVMVTDLVGDGDHLQAVVISKDFEGKALLAQHQLVMEPLRGLLKEQLHALAVKTYTPEQWKTKK